MPMFKIQPAMRKSLQLPYPIHADNKGNVEFPDIHAGTVVRVLGFQQDHDVQQIDLSWADAQKDPSKAVGMYLVSTDSRGCPGVHDTPVETFEQVVL